MTAGPDGFWRGTSPLLLASTSATRHRLLQAAGVPVEVEPPGVDERALQAGLGEIDPEALSSCLADAKALAVSRRRPGRPVLGADQVLACEGEVLTKAESRDEAGRNLLKLAGREHRLHSAFALALDGEIRMGGGGEARLLMRPLDQDAVARYVALAGEAATRSVGGYEIEGLGIHLFERIDGEHTAILGLPMLPLLDALREMGLVEP